MASPRADGAASAAAALIRPCLEKIKLNATGKRYAKLQQDTVSLLEKLDTFLGVEPAAPAASAPAEAAPQQGAAAPPEAGADANAGPAEEAVGVGLQEGLDGQMRVKLTLSPQRSSSVPAPAPLPGDLGHVPASPVSSPQAAPAGRRAGALADGAARGELAQLIPRPPCNSHARRKIIRRGLPVSASTCQRWTQHQVVPMLQR